MCKKPKDLLIDIGNSYTEYTEYTEYTQCWKYNKDQANAFHINRIKTPNLKNKSDIEGYGCYERLVITSVVPKKEEIFRGDKNVINIDHRNIPLIKPHLKDNNQIGSDRLVNALGAYVAHKKSCLVVDSGTALTMCYVDKKGVYEGGIIMPGLQLSSLSLNQYTAKIPLIYVSPTDKLIGKTTKEAVEIGLYQGFIHMINGFIKNYKQMDPEVTIIGTGKGLSIMATKLDLDYFDPVLIFKGLAYCAEHVGLEK